MSVVRASTAVRSTRRPQGLAAVDAGRCIPPLVNDPDPVNDETAIEAAVLRHIRTLNAGDLDAGSDYLADATDFGLDSGPRTTAAFSRQRSAFGRQSLDDPGNFALQSNLRLRDLRISIHKDSAVATGYLVGTVPLPGGGSKKVMGRSTFVHVRQHGTWKLAHTHLSPFIAEPPGSLH
jgi:ketosteroid isomerase-like protein